jgi:hypothetical protein
MKTKTALFFSLPIFAVATALVWGTAGFLLYLLALSLISTVLAAAGRLRGTASQYFPWSVCLFAPLWVIERSFSTYWALYWHLAHGGYPFGDKILSKGIGRDWIGGGRIAAEAAARQSDQ